MQEPFAIRESTTSVRLAEDRMRSARPGAFNHRDDTRLPGKNCQGDAGTTDGVRKGESPGVSYSTTKSPVICWGWTSHRKK
ncbi:MAG: hypothetical protein XE10_1453 [Methanoculleus marisnigri]|jgi:hypothetical protein|uniref:Uncharacterized protein n=2 Tax=Methanoculleus TaxID=45989 RepID=A0A101ISQ9_9EURY|nr:MAG: hypothetical protein XD82_1640 [Methanoculleus marisnigri]KUL00351.1 MAG: hypothetical protein XE10_1453 [Methanoculleus marisnigri]